MGNENQGKVNGDADFAFSGRNDVLRRFGRENKWLAAGLVSFAIFVLTLAGQDRHENVADHLTEHKLSGNDGLVISNSGTPPDIVSLNAQNAGIKTISRETLVVDPPALASKIHQPKAQASANPVPSVHRPDIARAVPPEIHSLRGSSFRHRSVNAKLRLIGLWHQSVAKSERPRSLAILWNSEKRKIRNRLRRAHGAVSS